MHAIPETSKTSRAGIQAGKYYYLMSLCDVDHATIVLTNPKNYSVQQFVYSFILVWTLDSTK